MKCLIFYEAFAQSSRLFSYDKKQVILWHIFGSHEASWEIHCDGWYKKKFERILVALDFDNIHFSHGKYYILRNITVRANKARVIDKIVKKETAYKNAKQKHGKSKRTKDVYGMV